jgi:hypothetical protein
MEYRDYNIVHEYTMTHTNTETGEKKVFFEGYYYQEDADDEPVSHFKVQSWRELYREIDERIFESQEWEVKLHENLVQKFTFLTDAIQYAVRTNAVEFNHFNAI